MLLLMLLFEPRTFGSRIRCATNWSSCKCIQFYWQPVSFISGARIWRLYYGFRGFSMGCRNSFTKWGSQTRIPLTNDALVCVWRVWSWFRVLFLRVLGNPNATPAHPSSHVVILFVFVLVLHGPRSQEQHGILSYKLCSSSSDSRSFSVVFDFISRTKADVVTTFLAMRSLNSRNEQKDKRNHNGIK